MSKRVMAALQDLDPEGAKAQEVEEEAKPRRSTSAETLAGYGLTFNPFQEFLPLELRRWLAAGHSPVPPLTEVPGPAELQTLRKNAGVEPVYLTKLLRFPGPGSFWERFESGETVPLPEHIALATEFAWVDFLSLLGLLEVVGRVSGRPS